MPRLDVGLVGGDAFARLAEAGNRRVEHRQPADVARVVGRIGIADPGAEIMAGHVQRAAVRQTDRPHKAVHLPGHRGEVVSLARPVGIARASRIERDDAVPGVGEQRQDVTPGVPTLRPAGEQQHGCAVATFHVMQADSIHHLVAVPELRPKRHRVEKRHRVRGSLPGPRDAAVRATASNCLPGAHRSSASHPLGSPRPARFEVAFRKVDVVGIAHHRRYDGIADAGLGQYAQRSALNRDAG